MPRRRVGLAEAEAELYAFLSSLFLLEPCDDQVRRFRDVLEVFKLPVPGSFALDELRREYFDLFVVPNPRYVRPYESVYRDKIPLEITGNPERGKPTGKRQIRGLLMGKSARDVIKSYRQAGVWPERELPDHIGNELSFLAYLAGRESKASGKEALGLKGQQEDFKKKHLLKWIGSLERKVARTDRTGYYRQVLSLTHAFLLEGVTRTV